MRFFTPVARRRFRRFRSIKRGFYSSILLAVILLLSLGAELFINSKALFVRYQGENYFPVFSDVLPGTTFGCGYKYETNYRKLQQRFEKEHSGNFVIMPLVPYSATESDLDAKYGYPPYPPSFARQHFLGTDSAGRDVLALVVYGFRIAMAFSFCLLLGNYLVGVSLGCLMGYRGGLFDLFFQRIIEIWSNIPILYVIIIIASVMVPNFTALLVIMVLFGWTSMTWYMRTATYKEKAREYVMAAKALGAGNGRIIFFHILPNTLSLVVTFIPFSISSGIVSLTSLDYLGFGLPAGTPSWGALLKEGTETLHATWIVWSVVVAMVWVLVMVTFIGEAIREAVDPKKYTTYE